MNRFSADRLAARLNSYLVLWFALMVSASPSPATQVPCEGDFNGDGKVTVDELVTAVNNALYGCPTNIGADQACTDLAAAHCAKLDQCVVNGTMIRYGQLATCQSRLKQLCIVALGANGTGNTPDTQERCALELPAVPCDSFDIRQGFICPPKAGTVPIGGACAFDAQCVTSTCAIATGTNCGTCAAANQAGDSCASASCSLGFFCVDSTQQCQLPVPNAAVCDSGHPCNVSLSCVIPNGMISGTCEPAGETSGAACDPTRQIAAGCNGNAGLYCNGTTKTCMPVTYATASGQCGIVNHAVVDCINASTCFGAQGQTPGTCIADALEGTPCDTVAGPSCLLPARCVNGSGATAGICRLPDPTVCE